MQSVACIAVSGNFSGKFPKLRATGGHPNLCRYVDCERPAQSDYTFLYSTSYEPTDLALVQSWRVFAWDTLQGLAHLHSHGVVHGSLAITSLRVTRQGRATLFGWGLSSTPVGTSSNPAASDLQSLADVLVQLYKRIADSSADFQQLARTLRSPGISAGDALSWLALSGVDQAIADQAPSCWRPAGLELLPFPTTVETHLETQGPVARLAKFGVTADSAAFWWRLAENSGASETLFPHLDRPSELRVPLYCVHGNEGELAIGNYAAFPTERPLVRMVSLAKLQLELELQLELPQGQLPQAAGRTPLSREYRKFQALAFSKSLRQTALEGGQTPLRRQLWRRQLSEAEGFGCTVHVLHSPEPSEAGEDSSDRETEQIVPGGVQEVFEWVFYENEMLARELGLKFYEQILERAICEEDAVEMIEAVLGGFGEIYDLEERIALYDWLIGNPGRAVLAKRKISDKLHDLLPGCHGAASAGAERETAQRLLRVVGVLLPVEKLVLG